jgi:hypothetical protein
MNDFTYVDTVTYATDPALLTGLVVGQRIRVTERDGSYPVEGVVEYVGRDEFGIYPRLLVETPYDFDPVPVYANSVVHRITVVD